MYIVQVVQAEETKYVTRVFPKIVLAADRRRALLMPYHVAHATRDRRELKHKHTKVIPAEPVVTSAQDAEQLAQAQQ